MTRLGAVSPCSLAFVKLFRVSGLGFRVVFGVWPGEEKGHSASTLTRHLADLVHHDQSSQRTSHHC